MPTPLQQHGPHPPLPPCAGKFKEAWKDADIKYIEPTYMIRSIPTIAGDRVYCKVQRAQPAGCFAACVLRHALCGAAPAARLLPCHALCGVPLAARLLPCLPAPSTYAPFRSALPRPAADAGARRGARRVCGLHRNHSGPCQHALLLPAQ